MTVFVNDFTKNLQGVSILNPASDANYAVQPIPPFVIPELNLAKTRGFLTQLGYLYSSGDYNFRDPYTRLGKYAIGYHLLKKLSLVKTTINSGADLKWQFSWTGGPNPTSIESFLSNRDLQDRCTLEYAKINYSELKLIEAFTDEDSINTKMGLIAVAHFITPEYTKIWRQGLSLDSYTNLHLGINLPQIYRSGIYAVEVLS